MATILIKNLKLPRVPNVRLNFTGIKSNFYHTNAYLSRSCRHLGVKRDKFIPRYHSTAAPQHAFNEDPVTRNNFSRQVSLNDTDSVDEALGKIDWIVKGYGRILMQNVVEVLSKITAKQMPTSTQGLYLLRCCKYAIDAAPSVRIQLVNQVWNRFQELDIKFDTRHYNALLEVHICNDFVFDPAEFLTSMEEQNLEPNKDTCLLLMKKYCKDGNLGGASEILEYMKEKGFAANEEVFNNLIEGHLNNKDFAGAKDIIEVMRSLNLNPTEDTHGIFACGYAAEGDKDQMMSYLLDDANRLSDRNCLKVIKALATSGNDQYVDDVLGLMKNIYEYRQECINTAVELVHKGCINTAYKLIIATTDQQYNQGTNIFIRQLIKTNQPASQVLEYCKDISSKGLNEIIHINAIRASSDCGNSDCAAVLLKDRLAQGHAVRNSSFFPLFTYMKKAKSSEGVWRIMKHMSDLGIPVDFTAYLDYIYPALGVPSSRDVIQNVKESGHFVKTATDALFVYYCNLGKIDEGLELIQTVPVDVSFRLDFKSFLNRYYKLQRDASNRYFQVLKFILEKIKVTGGETEEYRGKFLAQLISHPNIVEVFLRKFDYEDFAISEQSLNICQEILRQHNPASMGFFRKLKDRISRKRNYTIEEEEQQINYLLTQKSCKGFLVDRILHHSKSKNVDRVSELITLYEKMGFIYLPVMLAQLISLYAYVGDLEKTEEAVSKLRKHFPQFTLDIEKIFDFSSILIQYTKYDDALDVLKSGLSQPYKFGSRGNVLRSIRKLTNAACDTGDVEFVKKVQNLLMPLYEEFEPKKLFLEPIIDVHLHRNDIMSALDEYRKCVVNYRIPACLNALLKKCITTGDKIHLQEVIDVTVDHVGRNIALIELAVAFVETGYSHKAVSVLENLGHEVDGGILEDVCIRLSDRNKLTDLEQFISITKGLTHINRERLYYYLFKACAARNDYEKVIDMFNRLKEEDIEPSSKTVEYVTNLLKQNNQPIPICLLSPMSSESGVPSELSAGATKNFLQYLEAGDVEFALKEANELKKGYIRTLSFQNLTDLIDLCLQNNCTEKLSSNSLFMSYIIENAKDVLKPILETYSESGDVKKLISIANFIPDFSLKSANFNSHFCKAFFSKGRHEELLSYLEERYDSKSKMFSIVAFEELMKFPEFEDRILKLAVKYHEVDYLAPIAVVWAEYFIKGNYDKANELYKSYSFPVDRIDSKILRAIRQNEDLSLGEAYVNFIKHVVTRSRIKERAFGTVLDVLVSKQKYDEAVSLVLESEKLEVPLHKYFQSTLITLKNALERENKPIPFRIPSEELSPGSSSSDSE